MKVFQLFTVISILFWGYVSNACENKCECNCNSNCMYGEECGFVKECKVYKTCKTIKVCSYEKSSCCKKLEICHVPPGNPSNAHNICVDESAKKAHLDHGDYLGKCKFGCEDKKVCQQQTCCQNVKKCKCKEKDKKCNDCNCPKKDAGPKPQCDSSVKKDSGTIQKDNGTIQKDNGTIQKDNGTVQKDNGTVQKDNGTVQKDAGMPDLEVVEVDGSCLSCPDSSVSKEENDLELVGGGGCSMGGQKEIPNTNILLFILGSLTLLFGLFKKHIRLTVLSILLMLTITVSTGFGAPPVNGYKTSPSTNDFYTTLNATTLPHLNFDAQLFLNYEHKPLRLINKFTGKTVDNVLNYRINLDLAVSLGLFNWLEVGLVVPTSLGQGSGNLDPLKNELTTHNFEVADFKDLVVVPKVNLLTFDTFNLGFAVPFSLPTGDREKLMGENGTTVAPTLLASLNTKYVEMALNFGYVARYEQNYKFSNEFINFDDSLTYNFGIKVPVLSYGYLKKLEVIADLWGMVQLDEQDREEVPLEIIGGLRATLENGLVFNLAGGAGLTSGYGVPESRVLLGVSWHFGYEKSICKCKSCPNCKICPKPVRIETKVEKIVVKRETIIIPPVYFDTDKYYLRKDALEILAKVINLLRKNPQITKVRVEGHCDQRASFKYNEKLAWNRVNAVRNYLVKNGINLSRLEPRGYGKTQLVSEYKSESAMQKNRRVEFHILKVK